MTYDGLPFGLLLILPFLTDWFMSNIKEYQAGIISMFLAMDKLTGSWQRIVRSAQGVEGIELMKSAYTMFDFAQKSQSRQVFDFVMMFTTAWRLPRPCCCHNEPCATKKGMPETSTFYIIIKECLNRRDIT